MFGALDDVDLFRGDCPHVVGDGAKSPYDKAITTNERPDRPSPPLCPLFSFSLPNVTLFFSVFNFAEREGKREGE